MAKTTEFEIITEMNIVEPEGFISSLQTIGGDIFDKTRQSGYYTETTNGVGVKSKDQHFRTVTEGNIRYIHFDRIMAPYGATGFMIYDFVKKVDPEMRDPDAIGGIDIRLEVAKRLQQAIGECSIVGSRFNFDFIDDVPSHRHENQRLFILRKNPDKDTEEVKVVRPLEVISSYVRELVRETSADIYNIAEDGKNEVEDGLLIGYTTDSNPDRIQEFKSRVTNKLLRSTDEELDEKFSGIDAIARELAIRTKTNL